MVSFGDLICAASNAEVVWLRDLLHVVKHRHGLSKDDWLEDYLTADERTGVARIRERLQARVLANRKATSPSSAISR